MAGVVATALWASWVAHRPSVAICAPSKSQHHWHSVLSSSLQTILIPSIERTITGDERRKYAFQLYLGVDDDDVFWENHILSLKTRWLTINHKFHPAQKHRIPFNEIAEHAYSDGADYFVRINDDTEFVTRGWATLGIAALNAFDPPNVGVVGPTFSEGNTAIMTHDMVHRTHLDIFRTYYPDVFSAWWIDDWITKVYEPGRSRKLKSWHVRHHIHKHATRYNVQHQEARHLKPRLERDKGVLDKWLKSNQNNCTFFPRDPFDNGHCP